MRKRIIAAVLVAACVALSGCDALETSEPESKRYEVQSERFLDGGWDWSFGTVTDTETGIVYLVWDDNNGKSAVGGITPLLKRDGSVTIDDRYGEESR